MFRTVTRLAALAGLVSLATPALADPLFVSNLAVPYYETVDLTGPLSLNGAIAGQQDLTVNFGTSLTQATFTLPVWCVDLFHDIDLGGLALPYQTGPLATDNSPGNNGLSATQKAEIAGLAVYGDQLMATTPSNDISAGIQLAIWSVEYPTLAFTGGSAGLAGEVASYLALAPNLDGSAIQLVGLEGTQNLVALASQVPEPTSVALLGTGLLSLLGLGLTRRHAA